MLQKLVAKIQMRQNDAEDGLLPFMSPVLTLSMIAIAGLVASLRSRKE